MMEPEQERQRVQILQKTPEELTTGLATYVSSEIERRSVDYFLHVARSQVAALLDAARILNTTETTKVASKALQTAVDGLDNAPEGRASV